MRPILTAEEYRRVDAAYQGDMTLAMERAGHAVALAAVRAGVGYGSRVIVLAGPGNNGGDGYVAARFLRSRGIHVEVHAMAPPRSELARSARAAAEKAGVPVRPLGGVARADLVIDALFGGASRPGLPDEVLEWMETKARVIAVDYPTGLDPDTGAVAERSFVAVETVTFGCLKTGHVRDEGPDRCGVVTVVDIGISGGEPSMFLAEEEDAPRPQRSRRAHKWSAGSVLVLGGSSGLVGAAILAGRSALAFGSGSVYIASPRPELMQVSAPDLPAFGFDAAADQLDRFDVVVAGPGLAAGDASGVNAILAKAERVVLDAGGLNPDSLSAAREGGAEVIVTPHDAEFSRIAGVNAGTFSVRSFAGRNNLVVIRKGNPTMISDGGLPVLVTTGGPELASIGTGDVLAGMIGALWARGLSAMDAAVSGAYWHGIGGAEVARRGSLTAGALAHAIGVYAWSSLSSRQE